MRVGLVVAPRVAHLAELELVDLVDVVDTATPSRSRTCSAVKGGTELALKGSPLTACARSRDGSGKPAGLSPAGEKRWVATGSARCADDATRTSGCVVSGRSAGRAGR